MRAAVAGLLVAAAFVLSGCQYLLGGMGVTPFPIDGSFDPGEFGSFDPNDPIFSMPPPLATYTKGSATVTIDGKATTLDTVSRGTAYEDFGTDVSWTDGDGMHLRFFGEPASMLGNGFVILDRIAGGDHWSTLDPSACDVTVTKSDATGVSGSATCKGLRWADAMSVAGQIEPDSIEGVPPFDAEITFQATP